MNQDKKHPDKKNKKDLPGYPEHDPAEDIYKHERKVPLEEEEDTETDNDLDVPGAELDDANEEIGAEDEENNYYSLGGDNHEDLEEDQG